MIKQKIVYIDVGKMPLKEVKKLIKDYKTFGIDALYQVNRPKGIEPK